MTIPLNASSRAVEHSPELEHDAIAMVKDRLHRRHPDLPPERIDATVDDVYHHFDGSRVRAFVPVLVEHESRVELTDY